MLKVMFMERVISFENSFNGFLYILSQLPFIGKYISVDSYERNIPKKILSLMHFLGGLIFTFVGKCIYSAVFFLIPYLIMRNFVLGNSFNYEETILNIFIMMNCICGSFIATGILSDADEDYMLIHIMRIKPVWHYRSKLLYKIVTDVVFFFAIMCMFGIPLQMSIKASLLLLSSRAIGEFQRLLVYDKARVLYNNGVAFDVIVIVACVYFAYVSPYYNGYMPGVDALALKGNVFWALMLVGLLCLCFVWFYRKYDILARQKIQYPDIVHQEQVTTRARIRDAKSTATTKMPIGKYDNKKGYDYLNAIFFNRCRKDVKSPVVGRIYIIIIATAVLLWWMSSKDMAGKNNVWSVVSGLSVQLPFLMLLLSSAYKMCRTIYYNCDRLMLKYNYYRCKTSLMENFKIRLGRIILMDLETALVVIISLVLQTHYLGNIGRIQEMIPLFLEIIALSILYSTYSTVLYHTIQPYNESVKCTIPLFNLCNIVMVIVAIVVNFAKVTIVPLLIITVVLDIFMFIGGYILVKRHGLMNFKNRR